MKWRCNVMSVLDRKFWAWIVAFVGGMIANEVGTDSVGNALIFALVVFVNVVLYRRVLEGGDE